MFSDCKANTQQLRRISRAICSSESFQFIAKVGVIEGLADRPFKYSNLPAPSDDYASLKGEFDERFPAVAVSPEM